MSGIGDFISSTKEVKRLAAQVVAEFKGDAPGHPFRGNQWKGGSGDSVSFDNLDMADREMQEIIKSRVDSVKGEFDGVIESVTLSNSVSNDMNSAAMSFGDSGVVALGTNVWKSKDAYNAWRNKTDHLYSTNPADIIRHEGMHILDRRLDTSDKEWGGIKESAWNTIKQMDYDRPLISKYALTSQRELVAEAYVYYQHGHGDNLRKNGLGKLVDVFEKHTKRAS